MAFFVFSITIFTLLDPFFQPVYIKWLDMIVVVCFARPDIGVIPRRVRRPQNKFRQTVQWLIN